MGIDISLADLINIKPKKLLRILIPLLIALIVDRIGSGQQTLIKTRSGPHGLSILNMVNVIMIVTTTIRIMFGRFVL